MKNWLLFIISCCCSTVLFANYPISGGTIKGIITDSTKESIPGIIVSLENTPYHTLTDVSGHFMLFNIPPGDYKLDVIALGFDKKTMDIHLGDNETLDLHTVVLKTSTTTLNEISVVQEMSDGAAKAINLTKTSPRSVTITSSEEIAKLPNKNAADVVAHNPGVAVQRNRGESSIISIRGTPSDWSAVLVNGDRLPVACEENTTRSFEFEALPADLVDYAVESRTVTPDIESDNIGGSINFLTKDPEYKKSFGINAAGGGSALAKKPTATLNVFLGGVTKNKKFSYILTGSSYSRYYAADGQKTIFGSNYNHGISRMELRRYDGFRSTVGGNLAMEYKFNNRIKAGTHFFTGYMRDDKEMKKQSFDWYDDSGQRIRLQNIYGQLNRRIIGGDVYTEIKPTERLSLKLRAASYDNLFSYGPFPYGKNDSRNGLYVMEFISPVIHYTDFSKTDKKGNAVPETATDYVLIKLMSKDNPYGNGDDPRNLQPHYSNTLSAEDFQYSQSYTEGNTTHEKDKIVAQGDVDYKINNVLKLQAGFKYRDKEGYRHVTKHDWFQDFSNSTTPIKLTEFGTEAFSDNSGGFLKELGANYQQLLQPFLTQEALKNFVTNYDDRLRQVYMNELNSEYKLWVGSSYNYTEQQTAGYAQLNYNTNKLNLLGGLRVENTKLFEESDTLTNNTAFDTATSTFYYLPEKRYTNLNYTGVLPSLNATFYVKDNANLRMAVSRTMHRPNFEETKPGHAIIRYNDLEYTFGNPHLKPAFSYNADVSYEHFYGVKGMWSVGSYFKKIKDHIFPTSTSDVDPASGILIKKYDNAPKSWVLGFEGIFMRTFTSLPGLWSGFGVNANISYSISRMQVPGRTRSQPMTEQTPLLLNVALTYEKKAIATKIELGYNGSYLSQINLAGDATGLLHKDSDYDIYMSAYYSLDYQVTYTINKRCSVYLEANNLLNSPEKKYLGQPWRTTSVEYYRFKAQIGFKVTI
jgi:TonB-dependent receptor